MFILPVVIGCFGGGGNKVLSVLKELLHDNADKVLGEMTKVVLWESESLIRRVLSGLIQGE